MAGRDDKRRPKMLGCLALAGRRPSHARALPRIWIAAPRNGRKVRRGEDRSDCGCGRARRGQGERGARGSVCGESSDGQARRQGHIGKRGGRPCAVPAARPRAARERKRRVSICLCHAGSRSHLEPAKRRRTHEETCVAAICPAPAPPVIHGSSGATKSFRTGGTKLYLSAMALHAPMACRGSVGI